MPRTDAAARTVSASPSRAFEALVDPASLLAWLPPDGMTGRFEHVDIRPGGSYRLVLEYPEAVVGGKTCAGTDVVDVQIVDVAAGRRLVQAVEFVSDDPAFAGTMSMTWSVDAVPAGSRITIVADDVPDGISAADHAEGLESSLANLVAHLDGGDRIAFVPVRLPADADAATRFLSGEAWPFHGRAELTSEEAADVALDGHDVETFWIVEDGARVGLVRLLDLDDIGEGAPQFDLRLTAAHRGRGLGAQATRWIADRLFTVHPVLHRIEAATRADNTAMQRALRAAGFVHEGRLRASWSDGTGAWHDTLVYGILRSDWSPPA